MDCFVAFAPRNDGAETLDLIFKQFRRVGKGALAPCPPFNTLLEMVGTLPPPLVELRRTSPLCPPYGAVANFRTNFQTARGCAFAFSRHDAPEVCLTFHPPMKEGAGKAGRRLHPRSCAQEAHEWTTGSTGSIRLSLRDGVTAYFVLSSVTGLFATVDLRNDNASQPGWVDASPQGLTPASGRQDHTTSPSATVSAERSPDLVRSGQVLAKAGCSAVRPRAGRSLKALSGSPAIPFARPTLSRPPHPTARS